MVAFTTSRLKIRDKLIIQFAIGNSSSPEAGEENYIQRINDLKQELRKLNILEHSRRIVEIYSQIQILQAEKSKAVPE
jgi:uncharacterized coiled-coil DUF342 family protein